MDSVEQVRFFRSRLGRILPGLQADLFAADLTRANLDVMDAALKQVAAAATAAGSPPRDARAAVWAEYDRRLAEIAQLFPVFFTFESAWRSLMAVLLAGHYGADDWWQPIRASVLAGRPASTVAMLGGAPARPEVVDTVARMLRPMGRSLAHVSGSYGLLQAGTLGNVETLIERHWSTVRSALRTTTAVGSPTLAQFMVMFGRVRNARNDAYHHRVVAQRVRVVAAAETLLDLVDVHLGDHVVRVEAVHPAPFTLQVGREPRHI